MPELPEVEVVKLYLESKLLNKTLESVDILNPKSFIGDPLDILNQRIKTFSRVGKQLSITFENGLILLVHLKMTGQLIYQESALDRAVMGHPTKDMMTQSLPNKSTRIILKFSDNSILYFNDQRKFGWIRVFTQSQLSSFQSNLGVDIFDPKFTPQYLYDHLQKSSRPVKVVLLDQAHFAGIGNIYANDSLFMSHIHPLRPSKEVSLNECKDLYRSLVDIMRQSVLSGGSTAKDNKYLRPDGTYGANQFNFRVYQRESEPCLVCRTPIKRLIVAGRGTFYCAICQPK